MGWDSLVNIFNSIEMKKKNKKNLEPLAISEKDFKRPETLKIMSIFLRIHKRMNQWMKTFFKWKHLAMQLMGDTDYLHT